MSDAAAEAPRPRRLRRFLVFVAGLGLFLLSAGWLLQPERSVPVLLDRIGRDLGLEITIGDVEARFRGTPQLVVRDLRVREPGAKTPLLLADRALLSLPWSTLRSRGADLTIERVELDAPVLDVPALQSWLAKRPPGAETRIPTLTDGLRIVDGEIDNDDWRIEGVIVDLPSLHPDRPVNARLRGRYLDPPTAIPFDLAVAMSTPANNAGIAAAGTLTIERGDWRMPATIRLSGPLQLGEDEVAMVPARLGVSARYESGDTRLPFTLGLAGPLRFDEATWVLAPAGVALRGAPPLPSLDAHGALALGRRLALDLSGALPQWPGAWPALPPPVSASASPLPFSLRYAGKPDLSDVAALSLRRDATRFDARFRLYDLLDWTKRPDGAPLPPLDGHLVSPKLVVSGATLEGVEIDLDDERIGKEE